MTSIAISKYGGVEAVARVLCVLRSAVLQWRRGERPAMEHISRLRNVLEDKVWHDRQDRIDNYRALVATRGYIWG